MLNTEPHHGPPLLACNCNLPGYPCDTEHTHTEYPVSGTEESVEVVNIRRVFADSLYVHGSDTTGASIFATYAKKWIRFSGAIHPG